MMIRYAFLLVVFILVLSLSTTQLCGASELPWIPVGLQVNDLVEENRKIIVEENMFNNSIFLDHGCDQALNMAGGLSYLEKEWQLKSEKAEVSYIQEDEIKITEELEGKVSKNRYRYRIVLRGCFYSRSPYRCYRCRYMRRWRGRYFCCTGWRCAFGRIPRLNRRCSYNRCTIYCRCR
ncbi:unnamed protein product [Meganyctiphanes norvegica]|uniref:Uncharacterized protein n=1 Tax=Meganyctiphanes norvegica TaxID=48144 RepID=A0AAV2Q848_MEGNR